MIRKKYKRKKRGPVQAKRISYDGINFASGLERYMYMALKKAKIKAKYEGETFVLLNGFHFENECYARQANGKGDYKNRGAKRILPIKYTPDFIGKDFIIECKGRANESFPMPCLDHTFYRLLATFAPQLVQFYDFLECHYANDTDQIGHLR